jgi:hypothetical protein
MLPLFQETIAWKTSTYPARGTVGLEVPGLCGAHLGRLVLLLDAVQYVVLVQAGVVDISGLPAARALGAVRGNGGAVGGDLGRREGALFGCAGTHLGQVRSSSSSLQARGVSVRRAMEV